MTDSRKTLFISDLHLSNDEPHITQLFLKLLATCPSTIDAIYILGDLFEVWIGDDENSPLQQEIAHAIRQVVEKGIPVYFIHGNRDFLLGTTFLSSAKCIALQDGSVVNIYGQRVLLMHGDTLCTQDHAYLRARKLLRNPYLQALFLKLPITWRLRIADKMRQASKRYTTSAPIQIMDVTEEEVMQVMKENDVETLIHGHTHRQGIHTLRIEQQDCKRIVLGAWHEHGSVFWWDTTGNRDFLLL